MTWRPSESPWLRGVLVMGVLVVVITEGLGALRLIAPLPVALCWSAVLGGALAWHRHRTGRWLPAVPQTIPVSKVHPAWWVIGVFLTITFLLGIASAPNSWDATTYHLPRIERWVEQGHLGFWPTSVDRQLWMSPWPGYLGLQLRLLTGGDALAFLPAWLGYGGCVALTVGIVRQLGGDVAAQAWGALTMATIPPAVLQASAVQTDLVAGFWVLVVVALVVEAWQHFDRAMAWRWTLSMGAATSLALASKGSAALVLAPWLLLLGLMLIHRGGVLALWRPLLTGAILVLAINLPHMSRTQAVFGAPLGASWTLDMLQLSPLTPGRITGNVVANLSLHAGLPWEAWNAGVGRAVTQVNEAVGVDPAVQYRFYDGFRINGFNMHESEAGMPVHVLLLGALAGLVMARGRGLPEGVLWLMVAGVLGFLLLLAVLRWQPYGARIQMIGLLWLPALAPLMFGTPRARAAWSVLLVGAALPALFLATPRPLVGAQSVLLTTRTEQFAAERPEHFGAVEMALLAAGVAQCQRVGLMTGWDQPEYYLTAVARREGAVLRWEHLISTGVPSRVDDNGPEEEICALLLAEPLPGLETPWLGPQFELMWSAPSFAVYTRRGGVGR